MSLWLSIPILPGVRLSGPLTRRRGHGILIGSLIWMGKLVWWMTVAAAWVAVGTLALAMSVYWLAFIWARYGICVLLVRPCREPGDEIRIMRARISSWRARRRVRR